MITLPALSLTQPWGDIVVHHGKRIENRKWNTNHRGPFLLLASKRTTRIDYEEAYAFARDIVGDLTPHAPFETMKRGGIIGWARLESVIPPCSKEPSLFANANACPHPWHMPEQFGFALRDVTPLPFVPWNGALGFFRPPLAKVLLKAYDTLGNDERSVWRSELARILVPWQQDKLGQEVRVARSETPCP